jgi:hypothetical protein
VPRPFFGCVSFSSISVITLTIDTVSTTPGISQCGAEVTHNDLADFGRDRGVMITADIGPNHAASSP